MLLHGLVEADAPDAAVFYRDQSLSHLVVGPLCCGVQGYLIPVGRTCAEGYAEEGRQSCHSVRVVEHLPCDYSHTGQRERREMQKPHTGHKHDEYS